MSAPVFVPQPTLANRPLGHKDAQGYVIQRSYDDMAFRGEYTGTNLIYKAFARQGASEGSNVWQIAKCTYDVSNNLLSILWPQDSNGHASNDFQFNWTGRAGYTYS